MLPRILAMLALSALFVACPQAGPTTGELGETIYPRIAGGDHTKSQDEVVKYDVLPPIGGKHAGAWQNCGIYDEVIRNETAVHSLEHGAVWVTYKPELPEAEKVRLRQLALKHPYLLLSQYPTQDSSVIASAWSVQLKMKELDDTKLEKFLEKYMVGPGIGKETRAPEPGAQCVGGTGSPRQ